MTSINQQQKALLAPRIKDVLKKYNIKGSLSVRNNMTLVLSIKSSPIDFIGNYALTGSANKKLIAFAIDTCHIDLSPYRFSTLFTGSANDALTELFGAMNVGNRNCSDEQSENFDMDWDVEVNIGDWNKPYVIS